MSASPTSSHALSTATCSETDRGRVLFARLSTLAAGLFAGESMRVELGTDGWSWNTAERRLTVCEKDLVELGPEACAGILAHEVGHAEISRYTLGPGLLSPLVASNVLLNVLEDTRVERFMWRRYPGTRRWLNDAAQQARSSAVSASPTFFSMFLSGVLHEHDHDWTPSEETLPTPVRRALDRTRDARKAYADAFLDVDVYTRDSELDRLFQEALVRLPEASAGTTAQERSRCVVAAQALRHVAEQIAPTVKVLWELDVRRLTAALARCAPWIQERARVVCTLKRAALAQAAVATLLKVEPPEVAAAMSGPLRTTASSLLELSHTPPESERSKPEADEAKEARGSHEGDAESDGGERSGKGVSNTYERARDRVAGQIADLVRNLDARLPKPKTRRVSGGYATGAGLDLRRAMHASCPNSLDRTKIWTRRNRPSVRSTAVVLLVDLSGSMRGAKIEAAMEGTVLLAEALHELEISFAVLGFQDELMTFVPMGAKLQAGFRNELAQMPLEPHGTRPGGNNCPRYNDDGPCLEKAAEVLMRCREHDRHLVVISDGHPEGLHSTPEDLHVAVRRVVRTGIKLHALGLGPNTEHVNRYYPQARANVPTERLSSTLCEVLSGIFESSKTAG